MPFYSPEEIFLLTGKTRRPSQIRELRFMGIEHRLRSDGSILVSRMHVEKLLDGDSVKRRIKERTEPKWSAINA